MDESRAREILDKCNEGFDSPYYDLKFDYFGKRCLDGYFTADELEAMAWWMRNKAKENEV
jgi:hypothetical protein